MWVLRHESFLAESALPTHFVTNLFQGLDAFSTPLGIISRPYPRCGHSNPCTDPPGHVRRLSPDVVDIITVCLKNETLSLKVFPTYNW